MSKKPTTSITEKILFIQTGGTIDKDYPRSTKGWAFEIGDEPAFLRALQKLNPSFDYEIVSACRKDSLEITTQDRQKIRDIIIEKTRTTNNGKEVLINKIIITHGTDTMPETAQYLAKELLLSTSGSSANTNNNNLTIVITGAMRPERFTNTDADINIGMAIATVQCMSTTAQGSGGGGVYICMHGLVIPHNQIDRNMETGQYRKIKD